jgi:integrase
MKLIGTALSPAMPLNAQLAAEFATAGQAMINIAALLQGKRVTGLRPVGSQLSLSSSTWLSVLDLVNEFLLAKARADNSDRYLRQLKVVLSSFSNGRSRYPIDQVKAPEIEKWIRVHDWAPRTAKGYLDSVKTLFGFAVKRGYLDRNPALGVELPRGKATAPIGVHTPDQVKLVLDTARRADLDVCRVLAVRYFAGLRSAEAHRIRESDLKLDQGFLEVPASKSKTRSRRLVTLQPNLRAWLALGGELRAVGDMTIRKVIRLSKVQWVHNATRHSFVSYHLAKWENAAKTALEAGHSETMLFSHYRALVTPQAAAAFWAIEPDGSPSLPTAHP